jgi:hypothetical protein
MGAFINYKSWLSAKGYFCVMLPLTDNAKCVASHKKFHLSGGLKEVCVARTCETNSFKKKSK